MQMSKAILRNSEIVIFDKKNNFGEFFFQTAGSETDYFSRRSYVYLFAWIKYLIDKNLLNTRKPRGEMFHTFVGRTSFKPDSHTFVKAEEKAVNFCIYNALLHKIQKTSLKQERSFDLRSLLNQ